GRGCAAGLLNYLKSGYLDALSDGAVTALVDAAARRTSPLSAVHVHHMGGAVARVGEDETAYSNRSAEFVFNVVVAATEPAAYEADRVWAREAAAALAAYGHGGTYVNFIAEADAGAARDAYGSKYARLAEIKRRYDPANLLRHNQNIAP
nr:BBE domain-containing protein [Candidatus Eremiobacteraeota bacterium]